MVCSFYFHIVDCFGVFQSLAHDNKKVFCFSLVVFILSAMSYRAILKSSPQNSKGVSESIFLDSKSNLETHKDFKHILESLPLWVGAGLGGAF